MLVLTPRPARECASAKQRACVVQEATFEVSLAAEAIHEVLHLHYGTVIAAALPAIAAAEGSLRAAEKAEGDLARQCAPPPACVQCFCC